MTILNRVINIIKPSTISEKIGVVLVAIAIILTSIAVVHDALFPKHAAQIKNFVIEMNTLETNGEYDKIDNIVSGMFDTGKNAIR